MLIFLYEKKPFSNKTLEEFNKSKKVKAGGTTIGKSPVITHKMMASPSLSSKFSPGMIISKSPSMKSKQLNEEVKSKGNSLFQKNLPNKAVAQSKNVLLQYAKNTNQEQIKEVKEESKNAPVKKNRINLKNIEELPTNKLGFDNNKQNYSDLPITMARKEDLKEGNKDEFAEEDEEVRYEGVLYKITNTKKLKKLWFKLIGRDLYCK